MFFDKPNGSTSLRDFSGERMQKLSDAPTLQQVCRTAELGTARFEVEPHPVDGEDGNRYWQALTREFNARYLASTPASQTHTLAVPQRAAMAKGPRTVAGRASRGSQRQLQDYVNAHEGELSRAVLDALPARLQELGAYIRWVSPLVLQDYAEYRDADFLHAIGLSQFSSQLAAFWPSGGPSWDALAVVSTPEGKTVPGIILVEAKSHIPEIYGNGCQAGPHSRGLIEESLDAAKRWYGARMDANWTGPLYQSANRLAHLYFIRERLKRPAWLVNLYFEDDPYRPTGRDCWKRELAQVKSSLGLSNATEGVIELFLPALVQEVNPSIEPAAEVEFPWTPAAAGTQPAIAAGNFAAWRDRWTALAEFDGPVVPDHSDRIEQTVRHWKEPIPGDWKRGVDPQLHGSRYRRGNLLTARRGEHAIEYEILCSHLDSIYCCNSKLLDGINAFPLSRDTAGGGRRGNVEADMLLLGQHEGDYRLFLCEVKDKSNHPWFAAVESLRQLRLFLANPESQMVFSRRDVVPGLPSEIPVTALVLAPAEFYSSRGKKANAVKPALELIARCRSELGVDMRMAVWDAGRKEIRCLFAAQR